MTTTTTTTPVDTAIVTIGGIRIIAPVDLLRLANWTIARADEAGVSVAVDTTNTMLASRRLMRALDDLSGSDRQINAILSDRCDLQIDGVHAVRLMTRAIAMGEIEGAESRRHNSARAVAELEAQSAASQVERAKLEAETAAAYLRCAEMDISSLCDADGDADGDHGSHIDS